MARVLVCGRRCVLTVNPGIMVDVFLKKFLGADEVLGMEIAAYRGWVPGVLVGKKKAATLKVTFGEMVTEIGLGDRLDQSCSTPWIGLQTTSSQMFNPNLFRRAIYGSCHQGWVS